MADRSEYVRPSRATVCTLGAHHGGTSRLRPLKIAPADLALRVPVSVEPTGVVIHDGHPYRCPRCDRAAGDTVFLSGAGADHRWPTARSMSGNSSRVTAPSCRSIAPSGWPRCREARATLLATAASDGSRAAALAYLTELTHRRPQLWIHDVEQLHELSKHRRGGPAGRV